MQVRPVFHWLDRRVKAHVFLCMLAYYVEHHMRSALAPILFAEQSGLTKPDARLPKPDMTRRSEAEPR